MLYTNYFNFCRGGEGGGREEGSKKNTQNIFPPKFEIQKLQIFMFMFPLVNALLSLEEAHLFQGSAYIELFVYFEKYHKFHFSRLFLVFFFLFLSSLYQPQQPHTIPP